MRNPVRSPCVFGLMNIKYQFKEHLTVLLSVEIFNQMQLWIHLHTRFTSTHLYQVLVRRVWIWTVRHWLVWWKVKLWHMSVWYLSNYQHVVWTRSVCGENFGSHLNVCAVQTTGAIDECVSCCQRQLPAWNMANPHEQSGECGVMNRYINTVHLSYQARLVV